jgi:hypothetical protein
MRASGTVILSNLRYLSVVLVAAFVASVTYGDDGILGKESSAPTAAGAIDARLVPLGDGFLAIWISGESCSPEIRAMRLDRDGHPRETASFVLAPATYAAYIIAAVPDGPDVYVAWSGIYDAVHLTRVTADAVMVVSDSVPIPTGARSGIQPVMSASNGNILFIGVDRHVVATLIDRSGTLVRSGVTLVQQTELKLVLRMDLVAVNGGFLFGWLSTDGHPRVARITPADLLAADVQITPSDLGARSRYMYNIRLASDGEHAMVFWIDAVEDGSHYKVRARPLSSSGTPLGAGTVTIDFVSPNSNSFVALAVSDGYELLFSEVENYHPAFVRLSFDGTLKAAAHPAQQITAAQNGGRTIAIWTEKLFSMSTYFAPAAGYEAMTAPLTPDGIVGSGTIVSLDTSVQHVRKLVPFGDGVVALWTEGVPNDRLVITRFTASGQPLDAGLRLRDSRFDQSHSAIATDGERLFVVWTEGDEGKPHTLYGAIVSTDALSASVKPLAVDASGASDIAVVWNGQTFAVVYQRVRTGGYEFGALRVDRSGNAVDPSPIALTPARPSDDNPRLSWNGSDYLLVWQHRYSSFVFTGETCYPPQPPLPAELFAQRFSSAFAPAGLEIPLSMRNPFVSDLLNVQNVDVSFVAGFWLVSWLDKSPPGTPLAQFARIDASGARRDPLSGVAVRGFYADPLLATGKDSWTIAGYIGFNRGVTLVQISVDGIATPVGTVPLPGLSAVEAFVLTPAPLVAYKRTSSSAAFVSSLTQRSRAVHH